VYSYYVKDSNNCPISVTNAITVFPMPTLKVETKATVVEIPCRGDNSGVIEAKAEGGLGNYVYTLLDAATNTPIVNPVPVQNFPGVFSNLAGGTYIVKVDSGDCSATSTSVITISEPVKAVSILPKLANVTCNGAGNGTINVVATGGSGVFEFAISPNLNAFLTTSQFTGLQPGSYTVIAQDSKGCFVKQDNIIIDEPSPIIPMLVSGSVVQERCRDDKDGAFMIDITGGVGPYSTSLDNINGTYIQDQVDFDKLQGGSHIVYIKDNTGCTAQFTQVLDPSVYLNPTAAISYSCINNAKANSVTVSVDPSVDLSKIKYTLDGVTQASNVFNDVAVGAHTITVTHENGCQKTTDLGTPFVIEPVKALTLNLTLGGLNEIVAKADGGLGAYQYSFVNNPYSTENTYIYRTSGVYAVTVMDEKGCTANGTINVRHIDMDIPNVFTPDGDGNNDTWAPIYTNKNMNLKFYIFDRYGRNVGTFSRGESWDGRYKGADLPSGDYWYSVEVSEYDFNRKFVGHFTLYR
jgi:gliding motility-associated-like protein